MARKALGLFTGIIEDLGTIENIKRSSKGALLTIATALPTARIKIGDSIAVNGCCLTVIEKIRRTIAMEVSAESLRCTVLGKLKR
ncbi:MAG: riboflavin synthase, partial [Candidatus Binataceae bacterium]